MSIFPFLRQLLKENAARFAIINRLDTCMHGGYTFSTHLNWHGGSSKKKKKIAAEDQEHMVIELRFRSYHADRCTIYLIICY